MIIRLKICYGQTLNFKKLSEVTQKLQYLILREIADQDV
jgi:hypothetical protein